MLWNQVSFRLGWPDVRPVVVMSITRSFASACLISSFIGGTPPLRGVAMPRSVQHGDSADDALPGSAAVFAARSVNPQRPGWPRSQVCSPGAYTVAQSRDGASPMIAETVVDTTALLSDLLASLGLAEPP